MEVETLSQAEAPRPPLARRGAQVEVSRDGRGFEGGALLAGVVESEDAGTVAVETTEREVEERAVEQVRRRPPPPAPGWWEAAVAGDVIELLDRGAWWPMRVVGRRKGGLRLLSDVHAAGGEKERFGREKAIRPCCEWREASGHHVYRLGGCEKSQAALGVEVGGKARLVGFEADSGYNGLMLNVVWCVVT